jgi:hypothetical protein
VFASYFLKAKKSFSFSSSSKGSSFSLFEGRDFPHFPQVPHFPQHVFVRKRGREGEQLWIDMMMEKEVEACQRGFLEGWDVWVTPALIFGQNIHEYICFGKSVDTRLTRQAIFGV